MSLRLRLSLAFVFVVLAPLVIAAVLVARGVPESSQGLSSQRVRAAVTAAADLLGQRCTTVQSLAQATAWQAVATTPQAAVRSMAGGQPGYVAYVRADGTVTASGGRLPAATEAALAGRSPVRIGTCAAGDGGDPRVLAAQVPVRTSAGAVRGTVVLAQPLDAALLSQLRSAAGGDVTLLADGRLIASTLTDRQATRVAAEWPRIAASAEPVVLDGFLYDFVPPGPGRVVTVVARGVRATETTGLAQELGAVVVAALVLAAAIGWLLARMATRPLVELAGAAERVAGGDLDSRMPVTSRDEVGQLAVAFNEMTDDLRTYIEALRRSRDELRRNLARLGDTLSGTHDLDRILTVILETAMASVRARGGVLLMGSSGRGELSVKISRGLEDLTDGARVRFGDGILGMVAATGEGRRGWADAGGALVDGEEPPEGSRSVIAVPLIRSGRVLGVLGLYERLDAPAFDASDLETIRTFSAQATVAIDNVLLHQEAQRLSITDGLTGLWNYRYFTMNFAKEIERAARFRRPLALLLLDLDKFKQVNDAHGHQRGDSVLIELATRVSAEIREVDTFARYGGEEFVLVLPETDALGAGRAAERVCRVVRQRPFGHHSEQPLGITVSVGVAVFPSHGTTAAALIGAADGALYAAKESGRDSWRLAGGLEVAAGHGE